LKKPEEESRYPNHGKHVEINLQGQIGCDASTEFFVGLIDDHLSEQQGPACALHDIDEALWSDDRAGYIAPPGKHLASRYLPGS
jgi:hypothetical protein